MSKPTARDTLTRHRPSIDDRQASAIAPDSAADRLARLLDSPLLPQVVPHLPAEALHRIILWRGLDACSDLIASVTPAQLNAVLDLDLWRPAHASGDQQLDADRFGEWLEMLADVDDPVAAATIAAADRDLVVAGLSRYIRVFDPGIFEPVAQSDDEVPARQFAMREGDILTDSPDERPGAQWLEAEIGGYLVRARRAGAWDAIVRVLVALEVEERECFQAVIRGCRRLSNSRPEIDGLDDLLEAPAQHLHTLAVEREERRSRQGFATPADARAFLEMARRGTGTTAPRNPIVTAYFRASAEAEMPADAWHPGPASESVVAVLALLGEAGLLPDRPRAPAGFLSDGTLAPERSILQQLTANVGGCDEETYVARSRELAFLANALLAGCSLQGRPFTPAEAAEAAAAVCNLGLERWLQSPAEAVNGDIANGDRANGGRASGGRASGRVAAGSADPFLRQRDLIGAFELGWAILHREVGLFTAEGLALALRGVSCVDRDLQRDLASLRRTLTRESAAGTPWRARQEAEVLAMLDMTAANAVSGLLSECPVLPSALRATLERSRSPVNASAFEFIATAAQIDDVRRFMRALPDVLSA